jgi:hypothetical protein
VLKTVANLVEIHVEQSQTGLSPAFQKLEQKPEHYSVAVNWAGVAESWAGAG